MQKKIVKRPVKKVVKKIKMLNRLTKDTQDMVFGINDLYCNDCTEYKKPLERSKCICDNILMAIEIGTNEMGLENSNDILDEWKRQKKIVVQGVKKLRSPISKYNFGSGEKIIFKS